MRINIIMYLYIDMKISFQSPTFTVCSAAKEPLHSDCVFILLKYRFLSYFINCHNIFLYKLHDIMTTLLQLATYSIHTSAIWISIEAKIQHMVAIGCAFVLVGFCCNMMNSLKSKKRFRNRGRNVLVPVWNYVLPVSNGVVPNWNILVPFLSIVMTVSHSVVSYLNKKVLSKAVWCFSWTMWYLSKTAWCFS